MCGIGMSWASWPLGDKLLQASPRQHRRNPKKIRRSFPTSCRRAGPIAWMTALPTWACPLPRAHLPSSFGMTLLRGQLTPRRCRYRHTGDNTFGSGRKTRLTKRRGGGELIWKRHPRGGVNRDSAQCRPDSAPRSVDAECPEVYVQGLVRKRDTHWVVTLFLINGQEEPKIREGRNLSVPAGNRCRERRMVRPSSRNGPKGVTSATIWNGPRWKCSTGIRSSLPWGMASAFMPRFPRNRLSGQCWSKTRVVPVHEVPTTTPPTAADADRNPAFATLVGPGAGHEGVGRGRSQTTADQAPAAASRPTGQWIDGEAAKLNDPAQRLAPYQQAAAGGD